MNVNVNTIQMCFDQKKPLQDNIMEIFLSDNSINFSENIKCLMVLFKKRRI